MDPADRKRRLDRAAALLAADPAAADREARAVLEALPGDPNARLIGGSALRRLGRPAEAIARLEPLARDFPRAHPAQYELGLALADAGETRRAIAALRAATVLAPDHPDAWRALGALLFDDGDPQGADAAYAGYHLARVRDPMLRPAARSLYDGRADEAERLIRPLVARDGRNAAALGLLGEALTRLGRHAEAGEALARALERSPEDLEIRFRLARSLWAQARPLEAIGHLERLLAAEPGNPGYRDLLARAVGQAGDLQRALEIYEALLASHPRHAVTWVNYGHALRIAGRGPDAAAAYRRATAIEPALSEGYLGLANLKVGAFTVDEVEAMRALKDRGDLPRPDRRRLAFALGEALERQGDYQAAFEAYAEGAASVSAEMGYDPQDLSDLVVRSIDVFDQDFFARRAGYGAPTPGPIFVVGLPRSGSTLIEQILASHSAVEGASELPYLGVLASELAGYPEGAAALDARRSTSLGERYLASAAAHRRLGRPLFVDKLPYNFRFLGLIRLILPNARIIDARRHPMATCFSAFKQSFAEGGGFSYDLEHLGRFYRDYLALMAHFDRVLPGTVHRVVYEDLVADTEGEVRRMLDYLGLDFEPACLRFHETKRAVNTMSSEQVRRPIYREGLDQWRNFEPWLGRLKEALGPALEDWRGR